MLSTTTKSLLMYEAMCHVIRKEWERREVRGAADDLSNNLKSKGIPHKKSWLVTWGARFGLILYINHEHYIVFLHSASLLFPHLRTHTHSVTEGDLDT